MSRHVIAGTALIATGVLTYALLPSAHADTFPADNLPRPTCPTTLQDPANDAVVKYLTGSPTVYGAMATQPATQPLAATPNPLDPNSKKGLDALGVTFRVTPTQVQTYLKIQDLPETLTDTKESAYGYEARFTVGDMRVQLIYTLSNNGTGYVVTPPTGAPVKNTYLRPTDGIPSATFAKGTDTVFRAFSGTGVIITGGHDPQQDFVIVNIARYAFENALASPLSTSTTFSDISVNTYQYTANTDAAWKKMTADTTTWTGDGAKFTLDDACWPPAVISAFTAPAVQYGDAASISVKLADVDGQKVVGADVEFKVQGENFGTADEPDKPRIVKTDGNGVAKLTFTPTQNAGRYPVTVFFPGNPSLGAVTYNGMLTITPEVTKFKAPLKVTKTSATARTVTATLIDNDSPSHFVKSQKVNWYINGKKVATVSTTNAAGLAVYKGAKAGQTVQARFAAVPGKYAATNSAVVKV